MLALLSACAFLRSTPMDQSFNGVWSGPQGEIFVIANPYTIWGNVRNRHLSAFDIHAVDNGGFFGYYEGNSKLTNIDFSRYRSNQTDAQHDLIGPWSTVFPCIPTPSVPGDSGDVRLTLGRPGIDGTVRTMKMVWNSKQGDYDFSNAVNFLGKSPLININGTYSARHWSVTLTELGERSRRKIDGTLTYLGVTYSLHGSMVWTRGSFLLVNRDTGDEAGSGWLEWTPTSKFLSSIKEDDQNPSDRINVWVTNKDLSNGGEVMLTRDASARPH